MTLHECWGIGTSGEGFDNVTGSPNRWWLDLHRWWEITTRNGRFQCVVGLVNGGVGSQ